MKIRNEKVIDSDAWDDFVYKAYNRKYCFQQQNGCRGRGNHYLKVPDEADDFLRDSVPEIVNGEEMGVSFAAWLARDPQQPLEGQKYDYQLTLWWDRNFYPDIQMIANDLHEKGLLEAGQYTINIDW